MGVRGVHVRRKVAGGHHGAECGGDKRPERRYGRRARFGRAIVPQRPPALPRPRNLSLRNQRRDPRRLVDRPSARLLLVRQPVRSQARRGRAEHGSGEHARRPVVLVQAAGVDVGGAVAGHARLLSLADARRGPPGRLGDCPDGRGADHGGPVGLHHRPRDDPPARGVGAPVRRVPPVIGLLPALRHRAHLHPSRARRYPVGRRVRAQGTELLELLPERGGQQPHRILARPAPAACAPPPAGVALLESVLALLLRMRALVRTHLVDGGRMGDRGLRRAVPRRGLLDEDQQLPPALRTAADPPAQRKVRAGAAVACVERRPQAGQLALLQHATPCRPPRGGRPALSADAASRRGHVAATAGRVRKDVRSRPVSAPLVRNHGPAGRRVARALLPADRGLERLRQPGVRGAAGRVRGDRGNSRLRTAPREMDQPLPRAARQPREEGVHRPGHSRRLRAGPGVRGARPPAASRACTGRTSTVSPR